MIILTNIVFFFWSLLIPLAYLLFSRQKMNKGILKKEMIAGIIIQLIWTAVVWGYVYYSWIKGYTEYYYGWYLIIPVNIAGAIWCVTSPLWSKIYRRKKQNQKLEPTLKTPVNSVNINSSAAHF
jgi:hypothetical protein